MIVNQRDVVFDWFIQPLIIPALIIGGIALVGVMIVLPYFQQSVEVEL